MTNIIRSERQKPRALYLFKSFYASHIVDPKCGLGDRCPMMVALQKQIKTLEDEGIMPQSNSGVE